VSPTSFQKRQKEMKRQEKQKMKAERRAQKKIASREGGDASPEPEMEVLTEPALNEDMDFPIDLKP
jgi:hypothetical protein